MNRVKTVDAWLLWKEHNQGRSIRTVNKYRQYVLRFFEYLDQQSPAVPFDQVTIDHLELFAGPEAYKQGMSPRSRHSIVAALRGFYAWLDRQHIVQKNPAEYLPYPKAGNPLPRAASLRTAELLLQAPDMDTFIGVRDVAILAMLIGSTARISALCRMNQSDLISDHDGGRPRLYVRLRDKGNKERLVPLPHDARLLLRAYLNHPDLKEIDRTLPDGDQVLFVSLRNRNVPEHEYHGERRRISPRSIDDMIKKYGKQQGIPEDQLHPHAFRHLYGTELAESDTDLLVRQLLLGHADPKSTAVYTQLAMRKLTQVVDKANPLSKIKTPVSDLLKEVPAL